MAIEMDADCILLCQLISNRNFEFSRIAILSIRTDPGKSISQHVVGLFG